MAFFKFTALTIAIDACDVAIIAPRTVGLDTDSTVLMARGQSVLPALTPAEAAAEVDATVDGDPLMAGPYETLELGDGCYFGGRHVQRIAPTADGLGCIVTFGNVPAVLTVPGVDVDTMTDELNATGECGGGGGGGENNMSREYAVTVGSNNVDVTATVGVSGNLAGYWVVADTQNPDENPDQVGVYMSIVATNGSGGDQSALVTLSLPFEIQPPVAVGWVLRDGWSAEFTAADELTVNIVDLAPGTGGGYVWVWGKRALS